MMNARYRTIIIVAFVSGAIFLTLVYNLVSQALAVYTGLFSILGTVLTFLLLRNVNKPEEFVEHFGEADILNRLWYPIQDELEDVVDRRGQVTEPASHWNTAPRLSKKETDRNFFSRMERYVVQREHVASLASGNLGTEESRQELASEQRTLLSMADELVVKVNMAIDANPASATVARGTKRVPPRTQTLRTRSAGARPATSRPGPSLMRAAQTPRSTSASRPSSRPTPLKISDVMNRPEPRVARPPAPSAPAPAPPPVTPYVPTPVLASKPEVTEEFKLRYLQLRRKLLPRRPLPMRMNRQAT